MAGYLRPFPGPQVQRAATIDPFTGATLTRQRPLTAMEVAAEKRVREGAKPMAPIRSVAGVVLRPLPGMPGGGGDEEEGAGVPPIRGVAPRQQRVVAPGFSTATYAPDDGRRIGSKLGPLPALTGADYISANGGLGNPEASRRMGSLDAFYKMNPPVSGSDFARKQALREAEQFVAVGGDAAGNTLPLPPFPGAGGSDRRLLAQNTVRGFANGGVIPEGEVAMVGERGPELVRSTGNTAVVPLQPLPGMPGSGVLPVSEVPSAEFLPDFLKRSLGMHETEPTRAAVRNGNVVGYSSGLPPLPGMAGTGPVPLPAMPAAPWNPPPRDLLGQAPPVGSVAPLDVLNTSPWMQTKVNHLAMRELAKDPATLVKLQLGLISEQEAAEAEAARFRLEERGKDARARMTQEGLNTRQEQTQKFQREQGEATVAREKEEKLLKDAASGEALAVNAIIARALAAQGKVPKELAEAIAGMKSVEEQNQALNRVDYGVTGRAFNTAAPLVKGPDVDPRDLESVPVEIDPTTGKATRFELRPKRVEVDRDKSLAQLVKLYELRDSVAAPLPEAARPRIEREIARLEQVLDADGDGKPDGADVAPAASPVAPGTGAGAAPAAAPGAAPKWQTRWK